MKIGLHSDIERPQGAFPAKVFHVSPEFVDPTYGKKQMVITWLLGGETCSYKDDDGNVKQMMHSEYVTCSLNKRSKLRSMIIDGFLGKTTTDEFWRSLVDKGGKYEGGYDPEKALPGRAMVLVLKNNEEGYSKLQAVMPPTPESNAIDISKAVVPAWIADRIASVKPVDPSANLSLDSALAADMSV